MLGVRATFTQGQSISSAMHEKGNYRSPNGANVGVECFDWTRIKKSFSGGLSSCSTASSLVRTTWTSRGKMAKSVQFVPQIELNVNLRRMVRGDSQSVLQPFQMSLSCSLSVLVRSRRILVSTRLMTMT